MKYLLAVVAVLAALVALATAGSAAPPEPDFAEIDAFVAASMQESGLPGVAIAVVRGDRVAHMRGFGRADESGREVTPQTPFRIGSLTKSFTALAVMQLVEGGRVDLDAPVQRYLPWFRLADPDASARITVRHLLHQTSGIPDGPTNGSFLDPDLTLEQYVRDMASVRPNGPPGAAFEYANGNYNVLGLIVETVSGQRYADYVRQHVFAPLRMSRTAADDQPGMAGGYQWWFGFPRPARDPFNTANLPAGYISSTAEDLTHYLIAQLNGGRFEGASILSPEGIARMHEPGPGTGAFAPGRAGAGYGMGWGVGNAAGHTVVTHDGATWSYHARLALEVRDGWGVVVLSNADSLMADSQPFRAIGSGVTSRVAGIALPAPAPGIRLQYAVVDAVLLALSALLLWNLARLRRWRAPRRPVLSALRGGVEALLAVLILLGPPLLAGLSWPLVLVTFPDLGRWGLAAAGVLVLTALLRTARALTSLLGRSHAGAVMTPRIQHATPSPLPAASGRRARRSPR
jgi:CubicO group peptidase (beta-lactamase class C family)